MTPATRQQVYRQRRHGSEEPGRSPLRAINQRWPQDVVGHRQGPQMIIGRALALEVGRIAILGAQRRQLHDAPDPGAAGGVEQCDRRAPVDLVEGGARPFDQDADGVDYHMDASQPIRPGGGVGVRHVVNGDLVRPGCGPHAFQDPMAIARQGLAQGLADKTVGAADQDVHAVVSLGEQFMVDLLFFCFCNFCIDRNK
ncbi:hypothetical protein D3C85_1232700 [compost metagenome]